MILWERAFRELHVPKLLNIIIKQKAKPVTSMTPLVWFSRSHPLPKFGIDPASSRACCPRAPALCFCAVFLHQSLANLVPLCNFVFASLNCSSLFGIYQLERVSLSYIETVSHFWRRGEWRAYMIFPSPEQSGFHQDQKLNHVTGNSSGNFFMCVWYRNWFLPSY